MKKRKIAISIILATTLAASSVALSACSGDNYSKLTFDAQDTSYAVTSQGGSAVAYGNNVYYINGARGYDDAEGTANVWGKVVKGGLYRVALNGESYEDKTTGAKLFRTKADNEGIEFNYEYKKAYVNDKGEGYGKEENVVETQLIAPKTVGTSGYSGGGIFIYDNAVYFASPNNQKSATGAVQSTHTDFFMMPLSGGKPSKLYTTNTDTSSAAYAFYKYGDYVYLVAQEGGDIISVQIDAKKQKAAKPVKYEVNATSVYFPVRDMYYTGITTDTPEDFIYFVRAVGDDDVERAGTVIEAMRPDGSENFVVSMTGATETIEAVRGGMLFYRTSQSDGKTYIMYTNLHNQLMEKSETYKTEQDKKSADKKNAHVSGQFDNEITSAITSVYPFRTDAGSNVVYFAAVTSSNITVYGSNGEIYTVSSFTGTPLFIQNDWLYYSDSSAAFYRVPLYSNHEAFGTEETLASDTASAGISCDYAAGYFTYFAQVDSWASAYTYFKKVDGREGLDPIFVGVRGADDIPTEEMVENVTN